MPRLQPHPFRRAVPLAELEVNGGLQNRASWCDEVPGKIALQSEGAEIWIRNVRLRPIER